jgi:hypothetical protein
MWQEDDSPVSRPETQEMPKEENSTVADEVYIPDYVMLDFGGPENNSR